MKKTCVSLQSEVITGESLKMICLKNSMKRMIFTIIFPLQENHKKNGVVERKNKSLQEMARTMLNVHSTLKHFWAGVVNIACYLQNRTYIRLILKKTPYQLWNGQKLNISYFQPFGCQCFILNTKDNLRKFNSKCDSGILLGYSKLSNAYRVYNSRTLTVEETIHVRFNDNEPDTTMSELDESFAKMKKKLLSLLLHPIKISLRLTH